MAKNDYAKRLQKRKQTEYEVVQRWTAQLCLDCMTIALNEMFGIGAERLTKLGLRFNEIHNEAIVALSPDVSASHVRAQLDRELQRICGKEFAPWPERYFCWDDKGI